MTEFADALPSQPLPLSVAEQLSNRDGRFLPVAVVERDGSQHVCTMLIEGAEQFRGVGYDDTADHWEIVDEAPGTGTLEGLPAEQKQTLRAEIIDALEAWADRQYGTSTTILEE